MVLTLLFPLVLPAAALVDLALWLVAASRGWRSGWSHGVVVPVRRAARHRSAWPAIYADHRRAARPRLAQAPAPGLRPAHPLGAQPPGGRARAVRADVRDRGPRAGRARAGARPHPAREHHRQRAARRGHRARARPRPALRDQARARDAPDDRHRRPLGADELRAPRLDDPAGEIATLRTLAHDLGAGRGRSSSTPRARATPPRSSLARRRSSPSASREIAPLANRLRNVLPPRLGGPLALLDEAAAPTSCCAATSASTASSTSATSGPAASWARPCACASGASPPRRSRPARRSAIAWLYERWQVLDDWVGEQRDASR